MAMIFPHIGHFTLASCTQLRTLKNHLLSNDGLISSYRVQFDVTIMKLIHDKKHISYICFECKNFMDTERRGNLIAARLGATPLCFYNPLQTKTCTVNIT